MKSKSIIGFYTFGLLHHIYIYYYTTCEVDYSKTTNPKVLDIKQYNLRYLTSWNMGLQTLYFIIALSFEILLSHKHKFTSNMFEQVDKIRGYIFTSLVLPCTTVVAFFFWMFYHVNREFVLPEGVEDVFPDWVNHSIHTNILFLPIIELAFQNMYIPSVSLSLIGLTVFSHVYHIMYFFTYFETGKWMYPIHEYLSWPQRIFLMELMFVTGVLVLVLGLFVQKYKSEKCRLAKNTFKTGVIKVTKKLL